MNDTCNITNSLRAVIVDGDTLRAIGMRYLLDEYFGIKATIHPPGSELGEAELYIVTADELVSSPEYFMPRGRRTIVMSQAHSQGRRSFPAIDPTCDEKTLIERLSRLINAISELQGAQRQPLTDRERDVLRLIASGHINKEIADILNISFNTVLSHRKNITAKLGIKSASALAVYAMMNGLMTP